MTGIFHSRNPSGRTTVLVSIQPLRGKKYQGYFVEAKTAGV